MAAHEPWHRRADLKPSYSHSFWWFMFGNGGAIAAVLLPVTILVVYLSVRHEILADFDARIPRPAGKRRRSRPAG